MRCMFVSNKVFNMATKQAKTPKAPKQKKQKKLPVAIDIVQTIVGENPDWNALHERVAWKQLRQQALPKITAALKLRSRTSTPYCYFSAAVQQLSNMRKRKVGGGRKAKAVAQATSEAVNGFLTGNVGRVASRGFGVAAL